MKHHPSEAELALLAGGDCGRVSQFFLNRHVRRCEVCIDTVADFVGLREEMLRQEILSDDHFAGDWDRLAAEMRANIHLGLEAGECVRQPVLAPTANPFWNPRMAAAFASLVLLVGAAFALRAPHAPLPAAVQTVNLPVLESTGSGLELRAGANSFALLNHHGGVARQTVSAQGDIRASYIEAGAVTIHNVYLE